MPKNTYKKSRITPEYDDPTTYGPERSHYGNGRYPPDWDERKDVVWSRQEGRCARCGVHKNEADGVAVHHIVHLSQGGSNELSNLAGLCQDCHALMHPDLDWMDGIPTRAPLFPDSAAKDEVAVIRWPAEGENFGTDLDREDLVTDLERLAGSTDPDRNQMAVTDVAVPTSADIAKRAKPELPRLLIDEGYVPRVSRYHTVTVDPYLPGLRGLVTRYKPDLHTKHDAPAAEMDDWKGMFCPTRQLRFAEDGQQATLSLTDGTGSEVRELIEFEDTDTDETVRPRIEPPPLNAKTQGTYLLDTTMYLGKTVSVRGFLPALVLAVIAPGLAPFSSWFLSFLFLLVWFGTLLTLPTLYRTWRSEGV